MSDNLSDIYVNSVISEYSSGSVVSLGTRRVRVSGPGIHKGTWVGYEVDSDGNDTKTRVDFRGSDIVNRDSEGLNDSVVAEPVPVSGGGSACGAASTFGALKINLLNEGFDSQCDSILQEMRPWHRMSVRDQRRARRKKLFSKKDSEPVRKAEQPTSPPPIEMPRLGTAADQEAIDYREKMRAKEALADKERKLKSPVPAKPKSVALQDIFSKPIPDTAKPTTPSLSDIFSKVPSSQSSKPQVSRKPVSPQKHYKRLGKKWINKGMAKLPKVVKDVASSLTPGQADTIKKVQPAITPEMDAAWKNALKQRKEEQKPKSLADFFSRKASE